MVVPSSTVKAGRTRAPVLLVTVKVHLVARVASWPVVCTDWIGHRQRAGGGQGDGDGHRHGGGAAEARPTSSAASRRPERQPLVVAAAATAAGISITR